ncbi:MAG: hypothetical protein AB8H03_04270 [Saprospiraceae bacterium]
MIRLIKFFFFLILIFFDCSINSKSLNLGVSEIENKFIKKDSLKIYFNIIPDEIIYEYDSWRKKELEIPAELIQTNLNKTDMKLSKTIFYGLKSEGDSHIQVFDFDNNLIEVGKEVDYHYLPFWEENLKEVNLKWNESKTDTIDLDVFYKFEKGTYKIRFVNSDFDSEIVSNWDTLKVLN